MKNFLGRLNIRRYNETGKIPRAQKFVFFCIFLYFLQKTYHNSREDDFSSIGRALDRITEMVPVAAIVTGIVYLCWLGFIIVFRERFSQEVTTTPSPKLENSNDDLQIDFDGMDDFLNLIKGDSELRNDLEVAAAACIQVFGSDHHRQLDLWARHPNLGPDDKHLLSTIANEIRRQQQPENFFDQPARN